MPLDYSKLQLTHQLTFEGAWPTAIAFLDDHRVVSETATATCSCGTSAASLRPRVTRSPTANSRTAPLTCTRCGG